MSGRQIYIVLIISSFLGVESYPNQDVSFRIIGGKAANITDFPFMARFCGPLYDCGAAIVHERFLITSASCYFDFEHFIPNDKYLAIVGTDKRLNEGEAYPIEDIYIHPKYSPHGSDYDLAVLKLTKELKFNERIRSIAMPEKDFVIPEEAKFWALGFGITSTNEYDFKLPDQLQKILVPYIPHKKCINNFAQLTERMICAGAEWKTTCAFDNGGPLMFESKLVGVLIAAGCRDNYSPSVYAYIPLLRDFIDAMIENNA